MDNDWFEWLEEQAELARREALIDRIGKHREAPDAQEAESENPSEEGDHTG